MSQSLYLPHIIEVKPRDTIFNKNLRRTDAMSPHMQSKVSIGSAEELGPLKNAPGVGDVSSATPGVGGSTTIFPWLRSSTNRPCTNQNLLPQVAA